MSLKAKIIIAGVLGLIFLLYAMHIEIIWLLKAVIGCCIFAIAMAMLILGFFIKEGKIKKVK